MSECATMFICHYGLERSRAAAEAFNDIGFSTEHFVGGTRAISTMSIDELKNKIGDCANVILIYDQGSSEVEYKHKEAAIEKLDQIDINPKVISTASLAIMLSENGININDYLY